jgi:tetratricopeptide (TPR) repeat protein
VIACTIALLLAGMVADPITQARELYAARHWDEVVQLWRSQANPPAELDYLAGMAFARQDKNDEARNALESGAAKNTRDARFPTELAGLAFQRKDFASAKSHLHRALRLDSSNRYAIDLLGSVYFLEQNLDAALGYWNRIGKPRIDEIRIEPKPALDALLLRRALSISPGTALERRQLRASEASLQLLGAFPSYDFDLQPTDKDERFDLTLRPVERSSTRAGQLLSLFSGLPYLTLYPAYYNAEKAINVSTLARFDPNKFRFSAEVSGPVRGDPKQRFQFYIDGRRENWALPGVDLRLEKIEGGAEYRTVVNDAWTWSNRASLSDRRIKASTPFADGLLLKDRWLVQHPLLRAAECGLTIQSSASAEVGRLLTEGFGAFVKTDASVQGQWIPQNHSRRYEVLSSARGGRIFGPVPFDELYMLGLERDNDLPLAAHIGTRGGKKGSAPLGQTYFLSNSEVTRTIYGNGLFDIHLGPVVDIGRITDHGGSFGSRHWLFDTGARLKLRLLATVTVAATYGRNLRTGRNAFYVAVTH